MCPKSAWVGDGRAPQSRFILILQSEPQGIQSPMAHTSVLSPDSALRLMTYSKVSLWTAGVPFRHHLMGFCLSALHHVSKVSE